MDRNLFIFSFSRFRRVPSAALLAVSLFIVAEVATKVAWRPGIVGQDLYLRYSQVYDYGFARDTPRLLREDGLDRFYPTEYANIRPFTLLRPKPEDEIRVFVLGGSVSRGSGLRTGADYASQLESALNAGTPGPDWNVVNLSADGFGSTRMVRVLLRMMRFEPDALILHPHGTNEYEDERDAQYRDQLKTGVNGLLLRSGLVVLLNKIQRELLGASGALHAELADEATASLDPENIRRWSDTLANNVAEIDCIARGFGIPAVYVGRAERDADGFRNERVERLNKPIRSAPYYVDVATALAQAAEEDPDAELFFDNTHYSEAGHRLVAEKLTLLFAPGGPILERIESRRRAPQCRPEQVAEQCAILLPAAPGVGDGG